MNDKQLEQAKKQSKKVMQHLLPMEECYATNGLEVVKRAQIAKR